MTTKGPGKLLHQRHEVERRVNQHFKDNPCPRHQGTDSDSSLVTRTGRHQGTDSEIPW
jgi:hypothetical protein